MEYHYSYGVVPLQSRSGSWWALIVQRHKGFWEFPKGHAEPNETALDSATRELKEETGLKVLRLLCPIPFTVQYTFEQEDKTIQKTVNYFLSEVEGDDTTQVQLQASEIKDSKWVPIENLQESLTFPSSKELCGHFIEFLKEKMLL